MAFAFDTLGYAKTLGDAGIAREQAEAHAEAARDFIMAELVTRTDLEATRRELDAGIAATRTDLEATRRELETAIATTRRELEAAIATTRRELEVAISATRRELEVAISATRRELEAGLDRLSLRLTVRMGVMLAAGIGALAAIVKL